MQVSYWAEDMITRDGGYNGGQELATGVVSETGRRPVAAILELQMRCGGHCEDERNMRGSLAASRA